MDHELNVGEACACACGGARCQKGVARCEGRRFTSSRLVGGKEGEMMVLKCRVDQGRGEREADQKQQQSVRNREASRVDSRRGRRIMKKENRDKARLENADVYGNDKRCRLVAGWMDGQARWV
jgi:hypothetical protein